MDPTALVAAASGTEQVLVEVLPVFIIAAAVGIFVAKVGRFPYTIALLLAGFAVSIVGVTTDAGGRLIDIRLTHDLIFLVLLPPLLFEGAATTDLERLRRNLWPILALAVVGLIVSVVLLGIVGARAFGFPLLTALLFAAMVLPTDPVSVLALFEELGAPERLSVLVEGESLINDGVGVVLFSTFIALVEADTPAADLLDPAELGTITVEILLSSVGGVVVGFVAGYAVYSVMVNLDDHMTEIVLTFILAYGAFLLAEHYLPVLLGFHVSGVIATVVAGLFIGNRGAEYAMSPQTKVSIFNSLETAAFLVNTFIFVMIGVATPVTDLAANAHLILIAIPLVLAARALVVYPITELINRGVAHEVPRTYQHVLVWGGLHGSIPIALALGLDAAALPPTFPTAELKAMVFGVAAFSLVVQGLTMGNLLDRLGVVTRSEAEELYELLVGRARAVDSALDTAERLKEGGEIPAEVYDEFTAEYRREKEDLNEAIASLLGKQPELRNEQLLASERRILQEEKSAIMDAERRGIVGDDVGDALIREVNFKLDEVSSGESTVRGEREGYEEFWRQRVADADLDLDPEFDLPGEEDAEGA
ncbi:cation:proton antiporter [Halorarius halobius]|uniref:cation:proton antiporter n=1 Tax=Halorarius halobius TaxID=2962671 RepID=UPI0020CF580F|nr:cation:proton antiporter [Halorarius halobius]